MRWAGGELRVDYPVDQEMHLGGRGLVLVPSYFCWRYPVTLLDPDLPPVLIYPAEREQTPLPLTDARVLPKNPVPVTVKVRVVPRATAAGVTAVTTGRVVECAHTSVKLPLPPSSDWSRETNDA